MPRLLLAAAILLALAGTAAGHEARAVTTAAGWIDLVSIPLHGDGRYIVRACAYLPDDTRQRWMGTADIDGDRIALDGFVSEMLIHVIRRGDELVLRVNGQARTRVHWWGELRPPGGEP